MMSNGEAFERRSIASLFSALLLSIVGCDAPIDTFPPNALLVKRLELNESITLKQPQADIDDALGSYFGTPDAPNWPADSKLVSIERLQRAAGAVSSDEQGQHRGLYREHCIICHGTPGHGRGPSAALLNPYPRDFRMGKFKFKSTPIGAKPTRQDLRRVLSRGIPGTSMPAFHLLAEADIEALVDYLIYLTVRGEVERNLLVYAGLELDIEGGERIFGGNTSLDIVGNEIEQVIASWERADGQTIEVMGPPAGFPLVGSGLDGVAESVRNGKALFQGNVAGCAFCHGAEAKGDGQTNNFDDWTRDWTVMAGLQPSDLGQLRPMLELGALKPRNILPRNLTSGVFRGGASPNDLYTRIVNGIDGTPMPAAPVKPANPQGLTEREVWDIVNYLLSLGNGSIAVTAPGHGPAVSETQASASPIRRGGGRG